MIQDQDIDMKFMNRGVTMAKQAWQNIGAGRSIKSRLSLIPIVVLLATGCDVTNPGPIQDEFLNDPTTHSGLVKGSERMLLIGSARIFFATATITREIFPGGDVNSHSPRLQYGALLSDESNEYWDPVQQSRFIAEDAIKRFASADVTVDPETEAQAHIWAGYANKLLGENFCQVVFDGGAAEPATNALTRAENNFTNALARAQTSAQSHAAYAGRAQVRVELGDWAGAISDAGNVPIDFEIGIKGDPAYVATRNFIAFANLNENYRQYTYHHTYFFDDLGNGFGTGYYTNTGDPRVRWEVDPNVPVANASLPGYGNVPWSYDPDFPLDAPMILGTGTEMRLYEAEHSLISNSANYADAMAKINTVRAHFISDNDGAPLGALSAASADEAGTHLKNERLIDLHLEGRRLMDIRRWASRDNTPGTHFWPNWGILTPVFDEEPMSTCFPIPDEEIDINQNLSR